MADIILALTAAGAFAIGFFFMNSADRFFDEIQTQPPDNDKEIFDQDRVE